MNEIKMMMMAMGIAACAAVPVLAIPMTLFPLAQTRLLDGEFRAGMMANWKSMDDIGVERALYAYRRQAGLSTRGA